jgi:hypothetical protein
MKTTIEERIEIIAKRTGFSAAAITEAVIAQLERLLAESDIAWGVKTPSDIIKEARTERKNLILATHLLNQKIQTIQKQVEERGDILASTAHMIKERMGIAKPLPELARDEELADRLGLADSVGRSIVTPEARARAASRYNSQQSGGQDIGQGESNRLDGGGPGAPRKETPTQPRVSR